MNQAGKIHSVAGTCGGAPNRDARCRRPPASGVLACARMRVVVTGATGHVGSNLVRALIRRGDQVRVVVRERVRSLEGLDVERVLGDVRDEASLRAAFADAEIVYHLAAVISISGDRNGTVRAVNVDGTRRVAEAALAAGVRRLVHCSSVHAFNLYQPGAVDPIDEAWARVPDSAPHFAYDRSKAAGERALREVIEKGLDAVILHPSGVVGPYDFGPSRMGQVLLQLYHRKLPSLLGGGFAGAYTLGMFTRRANSPGVAIGIAASIVLTTIAWALNLVHPYFYLAISIMLCIVIGYAASLFFPAPARSLKGLTIYSDVRPSG